MVSLVASAVAAADSLKNEKPSSIPAELLASKSNFAVVIPQSLFKKELEQAPSLEMPDVIHDDDIIEPAYYYENMGIPVFTPTMDQFRSFRSFVDKINHYGMQSGIVKVIPPKEWSDSLPPLDEKVKDIKIKNPIEQHIAGVSGEFRQTNLEKQRTYNLPQWRQVCEGSDHQPPAKRGERRRGQAQPVMKKATRTRKDTQKEADVRLEDDMDDCSLAKTNPPTPQSPTSKATETTPELGRQPKAKVDHTQSLESESHGQQSKRRGRKTAKERAEEREIADEVAYDGFDYRIQDADQYTPERCAELEKAYWRTITYNNPLYGADMPGSLFDDSTTSWNVSKLENLLDCLGKKLPGVNTAYLYLGMWKSTFSWHLEDMDLYSINYIHFGSPKQWYSISRRDKSKFEQVMKGIWPNEAKKCSQFLRHKTFLVSPQLLASHGIKVNKLVHHQGEFVITFPFGYHSGYNLGYNCAESVNFATTSWLKFGRDAKKCECVGDSVFVDVDEIERKLRGDPTDDENDDEEDEEDYAYYEYDDVEDGEAGTSLGEFPTPPESVEGKLVNFGSGKKRKLEGNERAGAEEGKKLKKFRTKMPKVPSLEPCVLCPNDIPSEPLLPTETGDKAHRLCAIYTPETHFKWDYVAAKEIVANIKEIPKARLELKCVFCRQKKGSCFQCSAKKCTRAYHATCAAAAGVLVNMVDVQVMDEEGQPYAQTNIDYRCRIHRPKRPKDWDVERLEGDPLIRKFSAALIKNDVIQMQYLCGDIFAGVVVENRKDEETVLVQILPHGDLMEVEWKWILAQDPSETNFPDAITTAPLYPDPHYPPVRKSKVAHKDIPVADQPFHEQGSNFTWGELIIAERTPVLVEQVPVQRWWYYLGEQSTEFVSKYTEDPDRRVHNNAANFLPGKAPKSRQRGAKPLPPTMKRDSDSASANFFPPSAGGYQPLYQTPLHLAQPPLWGDQNYQAYHNTPSQTHAQNAAPVAMMSSSTPPQNNQYISTSPLMLSHSRKGQGIPEQNLQGHRYPSIPIALLNQAKNDTLMQPNRDSHYQLAPQHVQMRGQPAMATVVAASPKTHSYLHTSPRPEIPTTVSSPKFPPTSPLPPPISKPIPPPRQQHYTQSQYNPLAQPQPQPLTASPNLHMNSSPKENISTTKTEPVNNAASNGPGGFAQRNINETNQGVGVGDILDTKSIEEVEESGSGDVSVPTAVPVADIKAALAKLARDRAASQNTVTTTSSTPTSQSA